MTFNLVNQREYEALTYAKIVADGGVLAESEVRVLANALLREEARYEDRRLAFMHPSILCANGEYYDFTNPDAFSWDIQVIAAGLRAPRFTAQTRSKGTYSIAQHSLLASYIVPKGFELEALLHDAQESVLGDKATPFKILLPDYKHYEDIAEASVRRRYGLPPTMSPEVKHADLVMLATEKRDIMPNPEDEWAMLKGVETLPFEIEVWDVERARDAFIARFADLTA
ncbi:deoxyribonucleoside 5' monophosphate phosphatase [Caulobacter phage CcrRogue]|uniref:Putative HD-domain/PDEase-like protein n=1 Tax=Caulobacter phage CcrRogue TaxID=2927986 RepID=K4JQI7_9CAUD|nr:deoxyribonucleoside 5' monophosphate phosphatase [Caulobacter phage CcrRogue]AFU86540.1 putative HD-domain/PDEase-like protein [Caulobacter phage CcrRogue]